MLVFFIRAVHTRRFIPIDWSVPRFALNFAIVCVQGAVMILEVSGWIVIETVLLLLLFAINGKALLQTIKQMLGKKGAVVGD